MYNIFKNIIDDLWEFRQIQRKKHLHNIVLESLVEVLFLFLIIFLDAKTGTFTADMATRSSNIRIPLPKY